MKFFLNMGEKGEIHHFFISKNSTFFFSLKSQASTRKAKTLLYEWPLTVGTKRSLLFFLNNTVNL